MAKADLELLAKKAIEALKPDTKEFRQQVVDLLPQVFVVDFDSLKSELLYQMDRDSVITDEQNRRLDSAIKKYIQNVKAKTETLRKQDRSNSSISPIMESKNGNRFWVTITPKFKGANAFRTLRTLRESAKDTLRIEIANIFNKSEDDLKGAGMFLERGHNRGYSVAELMIANALKDFPTVLPSAPPDTVGRLIKLAIRSRERTNLSKIFEFGVEVIDESGAKNNALSHREKALKAAVINRLEKFITELDNWDTQKGSRSVNDMVIAELANVVRKKGGTVKGRVNTQKSNPSSVEKELRVDSKVKNKKAGAVIKDTIGKVKIASQNPKTNWNRLLPIINAQLPAAMVANMQSPRLVNRTGRLAGSARVIGVEQSPQGFATLVFEYERNPYDVFDRASGRYPWNTPQRDPKTLVAKSIRDIVTEMVTERFYTRRA